MRQSAARCSRRTAISRFTDGATDPNNLDSVFLSKGNDYSKGTALEFSVYPNHIELIDKDCVPPLTKTDGTELLTAEQANALNGYLHALLPR